MDLSKAQCVRLQRRINGILTSEFPWAKEKLLASRRRISPDIPTEDTNLWLRFRNALDRVATVQSYVILRKVPDPPLNRLETPTEIPEDYELPADDDPDAILDYARYLFINTAIEGWRFTADLAITRLQSLLVEPEYTGDAHRGDQKLKAAQRHEGVGRTYRSSNSKQAIAHFEKATEAAIAGIQYFRKTTPDERINREREPIHRALLYTSWALAVAALLPFVVPGLSENRWTPWAVLLVLAVVILQVVRPIARLVFSRRRAKKAAQESAVATSAKRKPGG